MSTPKVWTVRRLIRALERMPASSQVMICDRPFHGPHGACAVGIYKAVGIEIISETMISTVEIHPQSFAEVGSKVRKSQ